LIIQQYFAFVNPVFCYFFKIISMMPTFAPSG
jgi:hypothetical protein